MTNILIPFVMLGVGALGLLGGFQYLKKFQLINDIPKSKVRSIAMGLVEVSGKAIAEKKLTSPFSGTKCIYYEAIAMRYFHQKNNSGWRVIWRDERSAPFYLKDETGKVKVDPTNAEFHVDEKTKFYSRGAIGTSDLNSAVRTGINIKGLEPWKFGAHNRKYVEHYIEDSSDIYTLGTAMNRNKNVVIAKGKNEPTFIISDKKEKTLVRRLKFGMFFLFGLGIFFIGLGVFLLITYFGS